MGNSLPQPFVEDMDGPPMKDFSEHGYSESIKLSIDTLKEWYAFSEHKNIDFDAIQEKVGEIAKQAEDKHTEAEKVAAAAAGDQAKLAHAETLRNESLELFYNACVTLVASFPDGHVGLDDVNEEQAATLESVVKKACGGGFGFAFELTDDEDAVVTAVASSTEGIKVGDKVTALDSKPISEHLSTENIPQLVKWTTFLPGFDTMGRELKGMNPATGACRKHEACRFLSRTPVGEKHTWTINGSDLEICAVEDEYFSLKASKTRAMALPHQWMDNVGPIHYKRLCNGLGYLAIFMEDGESWAQQLKQALVELGSCHGLIVDLRGSLGGDDSLGAMFTNQFYSSESECGKFSQYESKPLYEIVRLVNQKGVDRFGFPTPPGSTDQPQALLNVPEEAQSDTGPHIIHPAGTWTKPVVGIINQHCISTSEGLARALANAPNGRVVGLQGTQGSFGICGGAVFMGDLSRGVRIKMEFPFGQSVDADFNVQIDTDQDGVGGILPTHPISRTPENLAAYVNGVMEFERRSEEYRKGQWSGDPPPDMELDFAKDMLIELIEAQQDFKDHPEAYANLAELKTKSIMRDFASAEQYQKANRWSCGLFC